MPQIKVFNSKKYKGEHLEYYEYKPEIKKLPLIIHIHGAGSRGNSIKDMATPKTIVEAENGRNIKAIIVAPHCNKNSWFDLYHVLTDFIDTMRHREDVDISRVYLIGISMGGYTAWQLAMSHPDWFAALVPICGGGMYWNAARLKELPIWAFHGELDNTVLCDESINMVKRINSEGGKAKLTVFPKNHHNSWDDALSSDELWKWLFAQKMK